MTPQQAESLGAAIRGHRLAQGLSARGLAVRADVDVTTITRLEAGQFLSPSPERLRRIAHALDLPATEFLKPGRVRRAS